MAKEIIKVIWNKSALENLDRIFLYISNRSIQGVSIVVEAIEIKIEKLQRFPEMYPLDKFKNNNDGTYRAFIVFHYRIAYRFKDNTIKIIRIRHTSQEPKLY